MLRAIVGRATGATARRKLEKLQLSQAKRVRKDAKQRRKEDAKAAKKKMPSSARRTLRSTASSIPMTRR
ncbi:hypothetical protein JCM18909_4018 [Cutibacterium acnes JCM 18909]|nr:hypothetical protein JCM18909_4018 [Cutibacterium acnes JCM 18909]